MEVLTKSERTVEAIFGDLVPGDECNIDCYTKHASHYEEGMRGIRYKPPEMCAQMAMKHVNSQSLEMQALDICVGTGMASEELVKAGFVGKIDGIDGNKDMMEEARKKGIFRNLLEHIVKPKTPLPFPERTYDVVLCTGAFSAGHVNPECIPDFFRVLKSGGILSFNTTNFNQDDEKSDQKDLNKAESVLADLVGKGTCAVVEEVVMTGYEVSEHFKYSKGSSDKYHCYRKK